jgi:peptidoglycan/xylan/chitin deacetylase (PgdA/CDA1 family)
VFAIFQSVVKRFSGGFVLAFHDIAAERVDEFVDGIRPAQPVALTELVERSKKGRRTSGLFAITVDDGIGETVRTLSRLFLSRGWPATFYVPTGYLDSRNGMPFQWWRSIRPYLPQRRLELSSRPVDFSNNESLLKYERELERKWHTQPRESYMAEIMELAHIAARERGVPIEALQPPEPVRWDEAAQLSKSGIIRFESHGVTHTAMSALSEDDLLTEMRISRDRVTEMTGLECRHLAYPFGSEASIGRADKTARLCYDSAVTMALGHVDAADPWRLPRMPLYPGNSVFMARMKIILNCAHTRGASVEQAVVGKSAAA